MQPRRLFLRALLTALQRVRVAFWSVTGTRGRGVLSVPLTPEGQVVLVRLTYVRGWHLPGGGVGRHERPEAAALRELREEIGMTAHGALACLSAAEGSTIFLVSDVAYVPRQTLEIQDVRAFDADALPAGATRSVHRGVAAALASLKPA